MKKLLLFFAVFTATFFGCDKQESGSPTPTTPGGTTKNSSKAITKFSFASLSPAVEGIIDEAAKTIKATVPAATDITKLAPNVTVSAKATLSPATGVTQDFSKEVSYTVTAEDGSKQVYRAIVTKAGSGGPSTGFTGDNLVYYYHTKTDTRSGPTFEYTIKGYNASTGKESGSVTVGSRKEGDGTYSSDYEAYPMVFNNGVLYVGRQEKIMALEVATGKTKWSATLKSYRPYAYKGETTHTIDNGVLLVSGSTSKDIHALSEADGSIKWTFTHNETINTFTAVNGILYAGYGDANYSGGLMAIEVSTGKQKWNVKSIGVKSNPAVVNGVVYYGDYKSKVYALDALTGTKKWEFTTGGMVLASPTVTEGIVYISSYDHKVYALDAATGIKKWDFTTSGKYDIELTGDASTLYGAAEGDGKTTLYALDKKTGAKKWETTVLVNTGIPVVAGGFLYYRKYVLDATSGTSKDFLGLIDFDSSTGNMYSVANTTCIVIGGKYVGSNSSGTMQ